MTWAAEPLCHSRISMRSNKQNWPEFYLGNARVCPGLELPMCTPFLFVPNPMYNYTLHACIAEQCIHVNYILHALWNNASFNIEAIMWGLVGSQHWDWESGSCTMWSVTLSLHRCSICCCCWERPEGMMVLCQYSSNWQSLMWLCLYVKLLHTCLWIVWNYITEKNSWLIMCGVVILVAAKLRRQRLREVYFSIRD